MGFAQTSSLHLRRHFDRHDIDHNSFSKAALDNIIDTFVRSREKKCNGMSTPVYTDSKYTKVRLCIYMSDYEQHVARY